MIAVVPWSWWRAFDQLGWKIWTHTKTATVTWKLQLFSEVDGMPLICLCPAGLLFRRFADANELFEVYGVAWWSFVLPMLESYVNVIACIWSSRIQLSSCSIDFAWRLQLAIVLWIWWHAFDLLASWWPVVPGFADAGEFPKIDGVACLILWFADAGELCEFDCLRLIRWHPATLLFRRFAFWARVVGELQQTNYGDNIGLEIRVRYHFRIHVHVDMLMLDINLRSLHEYMCVLALDIFLLNLCTCAVFGALVKSLPLKLYALGWQIYTIGC
jgi:hypothetical protein